MIVSALSLTVRKIMTALAVFALAACSGGNAFKNRVQEAVKFELTDPQSAQFTDDWYDEAHNMACGAVNARNQFGGYVGKRLWVWREYGAHHQPEFGSPEFARFNQIWEECLRAQRGEFPANSVMPSATASGNVAAIEVEMNRAIEEMNRAEAEAAQVMNELSEANRRASRH